MLNGLFFCVLLTLTFAAEKEGIRLQSKKRLQSVRLLPGQQQNPYSGYALPPGVYTAPTYNNGAQNGYPYQPRAGPNPGMPSMIMRTLPPIPAAAFPDYVPEAHTSPPTDMIASFSDVSNPYTRPSIPAAAFTDVSYSPSPPPPPASILTSVQPFPLNVGYINTLPTLPPIPSIPTFPPQIVPIPTFPTQIPPIPTLSPPISPTKSTQNPSEPIENMGYPPSILPDQMSPEMMKNQVGAIGQQQSTSAPSESMKHDAHTGLYLAMLLLLPCTVGGCCIGRMFFTPKQGLFYPEPLMYAEHPDHLSYPAGGSYNSNPTRSSSLRADVAHSSSHRSSAYQNPVDPEFEDPQEPYYATAGYDDPMYDYGGTPPEPKQRMSMTR